MEIIFMWLAFIVCMLKLFAVDEDSHALQTFKQLPCLPVNKIGNKRKEVMPLLCAQFYGF